MSIIKYNLFMDEEKHPILVKEAAYDQSVNQFYNTSDVADFFTREINLSKMAEERFYIMAMDAKMKCVGISEISHGTASMTFSQPREIFIRLLLLGAVSFVAIHNHPSGEITPSHEDLNVTKVIKNSAEMMKIEFLDHIIVGPAGTYFSFAEAKMI